MRNDRLRPRLAGVSDAAIVGRHRAAMFLEMGHLAESARAEFEATSQRALQRAMADGSYVQWLVEDNGQVVAGGGVLRRPLLPRPDALEGDEAIVLNMYVDPPYRRRGVGRLIMEAILDWCRRERIPRLVLHPSEAGRSLYLAMGFKPTGELRYEGA
jgi:GNAT superfamily N-acetyltransferase